MITLSEEGWRKNGTTVEEVLVLFAIHDQEDLGRIQENLVNKGYITSYGDIKFPLKWRITNAGKDLINSVLVDSDKVIPKERDLIPLATALKGVFPKGKKDGTNYYWAEGVALIVRRLRLFFKKYGNTYTDEQIVAAANKYVESFNGMYTYMKLLKYFIFKEKVGAAGEVEGESELINYIENADQEDGLSNTKTSTLI